MVRAIRRRRILPPKYIQVRVIQVSNAFGLIDKLLALDPSSRLSAEEMFDHTFFVQN